MSQKSINVNQIRSISASYEDMSASISDVTSSVSDGSAALLEAGTKEIQLQEGDFRGCHRLEKLFEWSCGCL